MNEDQKNFLIDTIRSEGWHILEIILKEQADNYRRLATQAPEAVEDSKRTWYAAMAAGIDEALETAKNKVS